MSEEEILFTTRIHPKILFKPLVIQIGLIFLHYLVFKYVSGDSGWGWFDRWGIITLHGIIVTLEVWYVVTPVLRWWNTIFTLTNVRVKAEWGVLYKQSREIDLDRISSISEERGILDRIFGCGSLNFYDAAADAQPRTSGVWNKPEGMSGVRFHDTPRVKLVRGLAEDAKASRRRMRNF